jgi:4-hydroxybenzoate polyprenyltransferase
MRNVLAAYRFLNILSLDVAAGAVICASFFARLIDVKILPQGLWSLGLTVWIIYTTDHLLDAKKLDREASTSRHRFHQRHFSSILLFLCAAVLIDITQVYFIRSIVFTAGLGLAFLVLIYFLVQQRIGFLKELLGALLYTAGILLVPMSIKTQVPSWVALLIIQFGITAWVNLLLFSWIDQEKDEKDKHHSFSTAFGHKAAKLILGLLFLANGVLSIAQVILFHSNLWAQVTLIAMNVFLLVIFFRKEFFERNDRYRLLGDAVFLMPLVFLLF